MHIYVCVYVCTYICVWPWVWVLLEARRGCLMPWAGVTGGSESPSMGAVTTSEGSSAEDPVRVLFCKSPQGWLTILIAQWLRSMSVLWLWGSITLHFPLLLLHYIGRKSGHKRGYTDWFWICLVPSWTLDPPVSTSCCCCSRCYIMSGIRPTVFKSSWTRALVCVVYVLHVRMHTLVHSQSPEAM